MPLIELDETQRDQHLVFVVGRTKDVRFELKNPDGTPLNTTGWSGIEAWISWNAVDDDDPGQIALIDASALSLNNAGVITGQVQPAVMDGVPRGRRSWIFVDVIPGGGLEHWTIKMQVRLARAPE